MTYALAAAAVRGGSLLNQTLCPLPRYPYLPSLSLWCDDL